MELIIGFLIGSVTAAAYINWILTRMKKHGYIKIEVTQKLKDDPAMFAELKKQSKATIMRKKTI